MAEDLPLAKKVAASIESDLQQQLSYYQSLGEENMSNEQLAMLANAVLQGKGGELTGRQASFAYDIISSWQLLQQLEGWEKSL